MDWVAKPAASLGVELLKRPTVQGWLMEQWKIQKLFVIKWFELKVQNLNAFASFLKDDRDAIRSKVDTELSQFGRRAPFEVIQWLNEADELINEYDSFDSDECHRYAVFDLCTSGYLPKWGIRCRRSIKASIIGIKINNLLQRASRELLYYWVSIVSVQFPSRKATIKRIRLALKDPNVGMIGLHGLSGVGKSKLARQLAWKFQETKVFDKVIIVEVTKNPDIRKIQGKIADKLGMTLDVESDIPTTDQIRLRLKDKDGSVLVILDDLWAKLDFNMLGIPFENDGQKIIKDGEYDSNFNAWRLTGSRVKGCKCMLISNTRQVLLSQMEGKEGFIFSLELLTDKEAEMIFKAIATNLLQKKNIIATIFDTTDPEFERLAAQIAIKCKGLPFSIVNTAIALKSQSRSVWEGVNQKLEWQKLLGGCEFSTKLRYELLENKELKYTFLLCAFMGQHALIMDLVKYCIGLGFLLGICTVREARDKVSALVAKLKEINLLSDSYSNDRFIMNDTVRSAALSIASEEKHVFTKTKGEVDEWPNEDKLEMCAAISLQHCDITEGFPSIIKCPRLKVFRVNNSDPHLKLPANLFEEMKELKVLILTGFNLSPLPSSIKCLTKLRMLCLEQCILGDDLSIIGELKKLRILSLSGSDIKKLLVELMKLTKLQIFGISDDLSIIGNERSTLPFEVLKKAPNLETMTISNCSEAEIFLTQNHEIGVDRKLEASQETTYKLHWLNKLYEKLHQLNVFKCPDLITLVDSAVSFSSLKELNVVGCSALKYLFTFSAAKELRYLEEITVKECESLIGIVGKVSEGDEEEEEDQAHLIKRVRRTRSTSLPEHQPEKEQQPPLSDLSPFPEPQQFGPEQPTPEQQPSHQQQQQQQEQEAPEQQQEEAPEENQAGASEENHPEIQEEGGEKQRLEEEEEKEQARLAAERIRKGKLPKDPNEKKQQERPTHPPSQEEIKFEWLDRIVLHDLPSLKCFYSGNSTLQLPSLIQVNIRQCPRMEIFSQGELRHTESFRGIQVSSDLSAKLVFHGDLNGSVKWLFQQQGGGQPS